MAIPIIVPCSECGIMVDVVKKTQRDYFHETGKVYCSRTCSTAVRRRHSRALLSETNRRNAQQISERMKRCNPMHNSAIRERMAQTLRVIGHRPPVTGGNGRGLTQPQLILAQALGWPTEVSIPTGIPRGTGYPTVYKVDLGQPPLKVAIEVDGGSHCTLARQAEDRKKEHVLTGLGWTVLRFSNRDVMERLEECIQTVMSTTSRLQNSIPT